MERFPKNRPTRLDTSGFDDIDDSRLHHSNLHDQNETMGGEKIDPVTGKSIINDGRHDEKKRLTPVGDLEEHQKALDQELEGDAADQWLKLQADDEKKRKQNAA